MGSQDGATAAEYAVVVALIAVVVLASVATLGRALFDDAEVLSVVLGGESDPGAPTLPGIPGDDPACAASLPGPAQGHGKAKGHCPQG